MTIVNYIIYYSLYGNIYKHEPTESAYVFATGVLFALSIIGGIFIVITYIVDEW